MKVTNSPPATSDGLLPAELSGLLLTAIHQSFNAVVITNAVFDKGGPHIVFCNAAFCSMTGYSEAELIGQSPRILQGEATDSRVIDELRRCLQEGTFFKGSAINYHKNGKPYHVEWNISPVRDVAGTITHFVSVQQDITEQVEARKSQAMLAAAINATPDMVVITDAKRRIMFVNRAFEQVTGYALNDVWKQPVATLYPEGAVGPVKEKELMKNDNVIRHAVEHYTSDGEKYFADQSIAALKNDDGETEYYVSISKDVSDRVETQNRLEKWANHDILTGLYSRRYGEHILDAFQKKNSTGHIGCCVVLCDIDRFKTINDTYGHHCGDEVLKQVAASFSNNVRSADIIVRWGGDEFLMLLPQIRLPDAVAMAERLRADVADLALSDVGGATLSIGVASWQPGEPKHQLLKRVDAALYVAKDKGRNRVEVADATQ